MPFDYVLPSSSFHQQVTDELLALPKGIKVLVASPGAGKSTYISYVFQHLQNIHVPVVRHHYFLSLEDHTMRDRTTFDRASQSLMHDLQKWYSQALPRSADNPMPDRLRAWIAACGQHYTKQNAALVIIIDGLDHVWREQQSIEELDTLLQHLLPTPDGIVVLLATQPVDDSRLPRSLFTQAPREQWLNLPLLDEEAVGLWLDHHRQYPLLTANAERAEEDFREIRNAFYRKSGGHPLHLRYTLRALQEQGQMITPLNIEQLPECSHTDITTYYRSLWYVLSEGSRQILHLLATSRFSWPRGGIFQCLRTH